MFDGRYACYLKSHEDCFCGAMEQPLDEFKELYVGEADMYKEENFEDVMAHENAQLSDKELNYQINHTASDRYMYRRNLEDAERKLECLWKEKNRRKTNV